MNNNWVHTEGGNHHKKKAEETLKKVKKQREGRKFELIKISTTPLTYREIEIK